MIIVRPIKQSDMGTCAEFTFDAVLGMTNLPRNKEKFLERVIHSEQSFGHKVETPGDEIYTFVLEDMTTGRIGGTCGIMANCQNSFRYAFRVKTLQTHTKNISAPASLDILKVEKNRFDASEVCALFLHNTFRHSGHGRLLSLSRFLFIAAMRKRFRKTIIAEMRGYIDKRQISPFWEGIGRHFCHLSFVELMNQIETDHTFIPEILPEFPIYVALLPKETQEAIGKLHETTVAAEQMLLQENFKRSPFVDIFEGGPILSAQTASIRSIKKSCCVTVEITHDTLVDEQEVIIGNEKIDFRSCIARLRPLPGKKALMNDEVAHALNIKANDTVRYVSLHA